MFDTIVPMLLRLRALTAGLLLGSLLGCTDSTADVGESEVGECPVGTQDCPCTDVGGCDPGLHCDANVCHGYDTETGGETGDGDGDGDGDPEGDGDGDGDTTCHPLMVDCPVIGTTCTWDEQQFLCLPGMIKIGDSCDPSMPQCISGFCAPMAMLPDCPSNFCCASFCNLDSPNCAGPGTNCVEHFPDGATTPNVGACLGGA
jgi:hypothetical protein